MSLKALIIIVIKENFWDSLQGRRLRSAFPESLGSFVVILGDVAIATAELISVKNYLFLSKISNIKRAVPNLLPRRMIAITLLACVLGLSEASRIFAVLPTPAVSHQSVYGRYLVELNRRGHDVTVATPYPINNRNLSNYRQIDFRHVMDFWQAKFTGFCETNPLLRLFPEVFILFALQHLPTMCHMYLSHPEMKEIVENDERFDLFIGEWGIMPCILPYMRQANNVTVGITSFALGPWTHYMLGSTSNPAYVPEAGLSYYGHFTFLERLRNTIMYINVSLLILLYYRSTDKLVEQYFGPGIPSVALFDKEADVVLTNYDISTNLPRPFSRHIVPIGGPPFHMIGYDGKALPKVSYQSIVTQSPLIRFGKYLKSSSKSRAITRGKKS